MSSQDYIADEPLFRFVSEHTGDVIIRSSPTGRTLYVSPSCRRYGWEPEALMGQPPEFLVHPDDLPKVWKNTMELLRGRPPMAGDDRRCRMRTASGDWVWVEGNPRVVRDARGAPIEIVNVYRDVSHQVEMEARLRENEMRYRQIAENTSDVIVTSDLEGRITFISSAARTHTGLTPAELLGRSCLSFMHPGDREPMIQHFRAVAAGGEPGCIRWRIRRAAGGWAWLESHPSLARGPETGEPTGYLDVIRDVGAQVEQEAALARARTEAEAATAAKSQFLANMSHEIRTPLTAVIGFTNLLGERDELHPEARRYVERIAGAGRGLLAVVNDILDFSQLEAGHLEIRPRPADVVRECKESVQTFAAQAEAKGLGLHLTCEGDIPAGVLLDGDRLRQMLLNLVGNAVKFTEAGRVDVTVAYAAEELQVEVRDTGPGLTPAQRKKLFQRFSQVDGSSTRRHGGTGLGLAICRSLAEAMEGAVDVRSRRGRGSCFSLRLPAPRIETPVAAGPEASLPDIAGLRIMVVDDNPANRELARALLTPMGVHVCDAPAAAAGLAHAATAPLDVILMDLRMPGMSGDQALAALRGRPGPNRDIPVLAFTATSDVEGRPEPELAAFDGVVRKPIDAMALYAALARATDWPAAAGESEFQQAHG